MNMSGFVNSTRQMPKSAFGVDLDLRTDSQ